MKTFLSLSFSLFFTLVTFTSFAQLKVLADGKVGIATANPLRTLEVKGQLLVNNFDTYPQDKQANMQMRHYNDAAKVVNFFTAQSANVAGTIQNSVIFGGGAGNQYAMTQIQFYTIENHNDLNGLGGVERMRINNTGLVRFGNTGALTHQLNLTTGDAAKPGGGVWATYSDARLKRNVKPFTDGLSQVLKINPVTYQYNPETNLPSDRTYVGVIAQEMQRVAPYTVEEVKVQIEHDDLTTKMPDKVLTYNGTAVTYMLINAIKEQQSMIDERDEKIEELETRLQRIELMLAQAGTIVNPNGTSVTNVTLESTDAAVLKQNAPNPFTENTTIEFTLPKTSFNTAYLQITNIQGAVMRKVNLPQEGGPGIVNIKARELPAGEYVYSLIIDGRVIDTKKMVLVNN